MRRRAALWALASGLAVLCLSLAAWSGSYLTSAAMLLAAGETEASTLRRRSHDKELARLTHKLALARIAAAREMPVPEEVVRAHPHLLLVLESYERAAAAAVRGELEGFLVALAKARSERQTFENVLKQSGWTLPNV